MAQIPLSKNLNVVAESDIEITYLNGDLNIIQKLDDEPNDVGGMTAAELKAKFDEGANIIKDYINETLIPEILSESATEAARAEAEEVREDNENARVLAESSRVAAENNRATAETARQAAEEVREATEAERSTAEKARETAEEERGTAEAGRAAAEAARVSGETERNAAEAERAAEEATRVSNETTRISAESERINAEAVRMNAEVARASAENDRANAEALRQTQERNRDSAEGERATSESARVTAEAGRNAAETTRTEAEDARNAAEAARATNETARGAAENIRADRETARQNAETARQAAEEARAAAETTGAAAETAREAAEDARSVWEEYNAETAYAPENKVVYQGSSYVNLVACTGKAPTDTAYWRLIAAKGADGLGAGDMLKSVYDPQGKNTDIFAYAEEHGGVQSDWAQNDTTAKDYVKNRFGGYYEDVAALEVEEQTYSFAEYGSNGTYKASASLPFFTSDSLRVVMDGVSYDLQKSSYGSWSSTWYGNGSLYSSGFEDTGDPICVSVDYYLEEGYGFANLYTSIAGDSHTVAIYTVTATPVPIPEKFVPALEEKATKTSVADAVQLKPVGLEWIGADYDYRLIETPDGLFAFENGSGDRAYKSQDNGRTWSELPALPYSSSYAAYGNNKFVVVPSSSSKKGVASYSEDAENWTEVSFPVSSYWCDIAFGGGIFVACSDNMRVTFYSSDGITWKYGSSREDGPLSLQYINDRFLMSEGLLVIYSSSDGISWSLLTSGADFGITVRDIAGGDEKLVAYNAPAQSYMYSLDDGKTWNAGSFEPTYSIAYGAGVFVRAVNDNKIYYSEDAENWTAVTLPLTSYQAYWRTVQYVNGQFIAFSSQYIAYSKDGKTWEYTKDTLQNTDGTDITDRVGTALGMDEGGKLKTEQLPAGVARTCYRVFAAEDWSDGTLTIPAADHGLNQPQHVLCQVSVLSEGVPVQGASASTETYATVDDNYNVILHYSGNAYAGAVFLVG